MFFRRIEVFTLSAGAVRNADRKCKAFSLRSKIWFPRMGNQIWVRTPQNRTYRAWGVVTRLKTSPAETTFNKIVFMRHAPVYL